MTHDETNPAPPEFGVPDDENPAWTADDFARALPFADVFPEIAAAARKRGRPKIDAPRIHMTFRFPASLADRIKAGGVGANGRVEAILQQAADEGRL